MVLKPESEISFTGGDWLNDYEYRIDTNQNIDSVNGASSRFYELWYKVPSQPHSLSSLGIEIQYVLDGGVVKNRLIVRSYGNELPVYLSVNNDVATDNITNFLIEAGDIVRGFAYLNIADAGYLFQFTAFPEMLYRPEFEDYTASIEFDVPSNSIKYIVGSSHQITFVRQTSSTYLHNYQIPQLNPGDPTYTGYLIFQPDFFDSYDGTWELRTASGVGSVLATVVLTSVVTPPEDDPPPSPIYVPLSRRGGSLNFW